MKVVRFIFIVFCTLSLSTEVKSQCTLSLSAKRSGCYISGGQSKFTISVEVGWTNAPSGQNIIITGPPGSVPATRTITPGTITVTYASNNSGGTVTSTQQIVSPQVVAFELDANSAIGLTVSGVFSGTPSCNATSNTVNAPSSCQPLTCNTGNLGGTVFFDFNADGIKQTDEIETGISGVTVTAIDVNGMSYTTTSVKYGRWVISGIANSAYPVRVEFSNLPGYARQGTPRGSDGNTTVQFISSADCNVDLGVLNNTDYCDSKPPLFTPCYVSGNPEESDAGSRNRDVFVMFDYDASGAKDPSKIKTLAYSQHVGSLWGVAFNKYTDKIFTSATIKRHAGMGPEGIGGLYVLDKNAVTPGVVTSWNVSSDFGINVGTFPSNTTRGLPKGVTSTNEDIAGFTEVGKVGIGDIDISENGNQLYMVNLFDRKLYRIDLTAYNSNPSATPTTDANWTIPDPGCTNGQFRPFAVKWYKGQVFVGAVCDASNGTKSNLRAYVFRLNPTTGVWTTIFDFPLTYPKGFPNSGDRSVTGWYPWTDDWNDFEIVKSPDEIAYPQPILSDIELDVEGSLIIGFADRGAIQTGYRAKSTNPSNSQLYSGFAGGDIIKAYDNGSGTYILENAAKAGPAIGYGPTNSQGPGFGEYYNDDWFSASTNLNHAECVMGGLALRSGSGQVITTHVDPVDFINWSGGVRHYNNTTGLTDQAFVLYRTTDGDAGTQGKAAGLGDLEVGCALPTFIEIGNRVWVDADQDGTQDPDEGPLAGVRVQLYKQDGTLLATTLTNAMGEYYFSSSTPQMTDPNLNWVGTGMDAMIQPSSAYYLVFGASQFSGGQLVLGGNNYNLTTANNESTAPANNSNDSDASIVSGLPRITINSSPISGAVNHTYDVGFFTTPCIIPVPATNICSENIFTNPTLENSTTNVFNDDVAGVSASFLNLDNVQPTGNTAAPVSWANPFGNPSQNKADYNGIFYLNNNGNKMLWMRNGTTGDQCVSPSEEERYKLNECTRYILKAKVAGWSPSSIVTGSDNMTDLKLKAWESWPNTTVFLSQSYSIPTTSDCAAIAWQEVTFEFTTPGTDPNATIDYTIYISVQDDQRDGLLVDNIALCKYESCSNCNLAVTCNPLPQTSCTPPNGSATTTVTGAQGNITYLWSSGETTSSISGKVAGTYTVTVTDNILPGCTATCQAIIGSTTTLPTATCTPVNNTNCASPNGSATVTTNANQILWSTGATTATITGLSNGTYTVTVTNTTTGCTHTCQAVVGSNTVNPTCNIGVNSQPSCANLTGGSFTVTPSPSGTYSYAWSDNGAATANRTGLTGGTYTVTVTNSTTGCTGVCSVTLDIPTNCCSINPITLVSNECDDNGTPQKITDNRMLVGLLVTNANNSLSTYSVSVNGGTTISPSLGTYGAPQIFTLGPGTAGGGATFRITVTDQAIGASCQGFIDVIGNVQCEGGLPPYCPTPQCGTVTIQVNGN